MKSVLVLVLAGVPALALSGCLSGGPGSAEPVPAEDDPVGRQWLAREPLPECGSLDVDQGERWRAADPEAWGCFADALAAGEPAELAVTYPTIEGDPIRTWFRLTGDGMEVYTDPTADSYGADGWSFQECDPPERLGRVVQCG